MQALNSKNYRCVFVYLKGDEVYTMPVAPGLKLMDYLTKEGGSPHVKITTVDGKVMTLRTYDITRVEPQEELKKLEDYT
jgi:hypothetical protein